MTQGLNNKYYVRKTTSATWEDLTTKFQGLKVLKIDGMNEQGDAVNVYSEQWTGSQAEDFMVTTQDGQGNDVIIRKNVDLQVTFICGTRYGAIDTQAVHDAFVEYMTKQGDFYIKSKYTGKEAHVVCLKAYKPTIQKLHRGALNSFIMGTIELHALTSPNVSEQPAATDLYIGFGGSSLSSMADITSLLNVQHYNKTDISGDYTIVCPSLSYLWVCTSGSISKITSSGFEVPTNQYVTVGEYKCYRMRNDIKPHTMSFSILN